MPKAISDEATAWLAATLDRNRSAFGALRMEGEGGGGDGDADGSVDESQSQSSFTQADVDRIVADRLKREREAVKTKYGDYDDLKKKAEGAKTLEDRVAEMQQQIESSQREALRRRVQAAHGISDEDADLFLTGTDEDALTAQAKRLAERESERKKKNNVSPREGTNPTAKDDPMREFSRRLFKREE